MELTGPFNSINEAMLNQTDMVQWHHFQQRINPEENNQIQFNPAG